MIDIIIPAYNSHKTIEQTLFSISLQENIKDLNVYIVNDASNKDYRNQVEFFSKFMNIKELTLKENRGPGYARQYGIDHSNSEYIFFIDSDDVLYDSCSLINLLNTIQSNDYDLVISNFIEEVNNNFILREEETIFVHGKLYKREFLEKNNIRFNDSRTDEDNGFNQLLLFHLPKVYMLREKTVIWKNNKDSVTRNGNHDFVEFNLGGYVYNITWAIEEGIKRGCNVDRMSKLAFTTLLSLYYYYLLLNDERIIKYLNPLYNIYITIPVNIEDEKNLIEEQFEYSLKTCPKYMMICPKITFTDFLVLVSKAGDNK